MDFINWVVSWLKKQWKDFIDFSEYYAEMKAEEGDL